MCGITQIIRQKTYKNNLNNIKYVKYLRLTIFVKVFYVKQLQRNNI